MKHYEVNQGVCTIRAIRGWFDFSMQSNIPAHTLGKITAILMSNEDDMVYEVRFQQEFGKVAIHHRDLDLAIY